ncbi:MAG: restriction endonuclease subunit S [Thermoproteota archaeon]
MTSSFKILYSEIEDRLLVPFYRLKEITNKFNTTIGSEAESITNGIDLRTFVEDGTLYIRVSDIKRGQINLQTAKKVKENLRDVPKKIIVNINDILISRKGTPGITSIATELEEKCIIGTEIIKITLRKDSKLLPKFVFAFLNSNIGIAQIFSKLTGTVSRGINHPALKTIRLPLPSKETQIKISKLIEEALKNHVLALSKIEDAKTIFTKELAVKETKINKNKFYTVFFKDLNDMFTPRYYYPLYQQTTKEIEKKFKTIRLGDISDIKRGDEPGSKNYKPLLNKETDDIPFIRTSDIVNYEIDDYPDFYLSPDIYNELNQDLKEGDILFTNDGKIGLSAILCKNDKCVIQSHIRRVRINKELSPEYVFAFLNTTAGLYQIYRRIIIQSTIPTIGDGLAEIKIPLISEDKQKDISKLVKEAFDLKVKKKELIRKAIKEVENLILE